MLEAIERAGTEVCLSSFAQTVMQGTWRNNTVPSREEMVNSNDETFELFKSQEVMCI